MASVAITVEGVLRKPVGGQPIAAGVDLYFGLVTRAKIVLLTDSREDDPELRTWLTLEGMQEHVRVVYAPVAAVTKEEQRYWQVTHCGHHDLELVIEPDPEIAALLFREGYPVLVYAAPAYSLPQWRPDYRHKPAPWDMLSQQVADEAMRRAEDER